MISDLNIFIKSQENYINKYLNSSEEELQESFQNYCNLKLLIEEDAPKNIWEYRVSQIAICYKQINDVKSYQKKLKQKL